jgi:hypothetical protein
MYPFGATSVAPFYRIKPRVDAKELLISLGIFEAVQKSPPYFVPPSDNEASLASLGTASLLTSFGTALRDVIVCLGYSV